MSVFTRARRPSPAMIVAFLALSLALAGSAVAGTNGLYAKVTKSKVKQIAKKEIKKAAPGLSVAEAENATTVGGQAGQEIFTKIATGTGPTTVLESNGLTLTVGCAGGLLQFNATSSVDDTIFASNVSSGTSVGGGRSSDFDANDTLNVIEGVPRGQGTFTYSQPDGHYVSGTFNADDHITFGTFDGCVVVGTVFSG